MRRVRAFVAIASAAVGLLVLVSAMVDDALRRRSSAAEAVTIASTLVELCLLSFLALGRMGTRRAVAASVAAGPLLYVFLGFLYVTLPGAYWNPWMWPVDFFGQLTCALFRVCPP